MLIYFSFLLICLHLGCHWPNQFGLGWVLLSYVTLWHHPHPIAGDRGSRGMGTWLEITPSACLATLLPVDPPVSCMRCRWENNLIYNLPTEPSLEAQSVP